MIKQNYYIIGILLPLFVINCARFRIQDLQANAIFQLPLVVDQQKNPNMYVHTFRNNNMLYNLPLHPAITNSKIYIGDAEQRLIRIFEEDETQAQEIWGIQKPLESTKIPFYKINNLGVPGWISASPNNKHIYIQSLVLETEKITKKTQYRPVEKRNPVIQSKINQAPSYILHLGPHAVGYGLLGREGYNTTPFTMIMRMDCDNNGRLYVLHKIKNELELLVYQKGRLVQHYTKPQINLDYDKKTQQIITEEIRPALNNDFVIGALSVRNKSDFKLTKRIIYYQSSSQSLPQNNSLQRDKVWILLEGSNPNDFLSWVTPNGEFYMLHSDADNSQILFKIFSEEGEYLSNLRLPLEKGPGSWRETFFSLSGKIYSSRLHKGKYIVYEWR